MRERNIILMKQIMSDFMIDKLIRGHVIHLCDLFEGEIRYDEHMQIIICQIQKILMTVG